MHPMVAHAMAGNPTTNLVDLFRLQQARTTYVGEKWKLIELRGTKKKAITCLCEGPLSRLWTEVP